jgi:hypothetical protein
MQTPSPQPRISMRSTRVLLASVMLLCARRADAGECGKEWQRACCVLERTPSCEQGLVESKQCAHRHSSTVHPLSPGKDACKCDVGAGWSLGECIDDEKQVGPIAACWLNPNDRGQPPLPDPKTGRSMSLYVAGFNHDNFDTNRNVRKIGRDELLATIVNDQDLLPEDLVVAFSESGIQSDGWCDPGPFHNAGPYLLADPLRKPRHAECLAHQLQNSALMGDRKFRVTEWDYSVRGLEDDSSGALHGGTIALITGERWHPIETYKIMLPPAAEPERVCQEFDGKCLSVLGVRLQGQADPYGSVQFVIYIGHFENHQNADANCDEPFNSNLHSNINVREFTKRAKEHERPGDLTPVLVGDFNSDNFHCLAEGTQDWYWWANHDVTCNGHALEMQNDIIHIFVGKPKSAAHPDGFASQPEQLAGYFSPIRARYSAGPDGAPLVEGRPRVGIFLPHSAHNVLAMDFAITFYQPEPKADPQPTPCKCRSDGARGDGNVAGTLMVLAIASLAGVVRRRRWCRR